MKTRPLTWAVESGYRFLSRASKYNAWSHFQQLQKNQWLSNEELERLRWDKLRDLLAHTETTIPFYRKLWREAGVEPARFSRFEDIRELPIVTKEDLIRAQKADALGLSRRDDFEMTHTSGTTGPCLYLPFTKSDMQVKYASYLRSYYATDWRLGMRSAAMHYSGHPEFCGRYAAKPERDNFSAIRTTAFRFAHRRILLTPYHESRSGDDSFAAEWYDKLRRHKPFLLESMDFNLVALNNYIRNEGLPPLKIPRTVVLATLAQGFRKRLEKAFGTEIFNIYGPHEIEGVAYACHHHMGMHLAMDCVHAEFLDEDDQPVEPGDEGHLVLTDFHGTVMPLIRYKIGDIASALSSPCECGRTFPLMEDIKSRAKDRFLYAQAGLASPSRLVERLQEEPAIDLFQIVQKPDGHIEAQVVTDAAAWSENVAERLRNACSALIPGGGTNFSVREVDAVPLESNGKFCFAKRVEEPGPESDVRPCAS